MPDAISSAPPGRSLTRYSQLYITVSCDRDSLASFPSQPLLCSPARAPEPASGASITLTAVADALVASAQPVNNYGAAGSLSIAAPGLLNGEFQSLLHFDAAAAQQLFDTTFGPGQWVVQSASLRLTANSPTNPLFNASAAGSFHAHWMQNDAWLEGSGTPAAPGASGITFNSLPSFLSPADEFPRAFSFDGATNGPANYSLQLPAALTADLAAGGLVSFRLFAADASVSYLFNSRTFGTTANRPVLTLEAIPEPATIALAICACFFLAAK